MNNFIETLFLFRTLWLSGRWGGGKTALAVEIALRILLSRRAEFIVSNVPLVFTPLTVIKPSEVPDCKFSVIIMDEAWSYLESGSWKSAKDWIAYLRKRDQVMLLPSVLPLTTYVRRLSVERTFNGLPMGVPFWLYRWVIDYGETSGRKQKTGRFPWIRPQSIFGLYKHRAEPGDEFYVYGFAEAHEGGGSSEGVV